MIAKIEPTCRHPYKSHPGCRSCANARKRKKQLGTCKNGHRWTASNTITRAGSTIRQCKACWLARPRQKAAARNSLPRGTTKRVLERAMYVCAYGGRTCNRASTADHVIPKRLRRYEARIGFSLNAMDNLVAACLFHNLAKGPRLLIPPSWADRLDELNALGIGIFRVWHGDAALLRINARDGPAEVPT